MIHSMEYVYSPASKRVSEYFNNHKIISASRKTRTGCFNTFNRTIHISDIQCHVISNGKNISIKVKLTPSQERLTIKFFH